MNKRHYEHTLPNIRGSLSNTYGLVRNYDNIAAKNDNGNRMDGVIAVVWMVGYGLAGSVVINAIRAAAMSINLSV